MVILHHFTLCPFSRKCRLYLAEKHIEAELIETRVWDLDPDARAAFLAEQPTGETPLLRAEGRAIGDSVAIVEYLEESFGGRRLTPDAAIDRAAARAAAQSFDVAFHNAAVRPLLRERVLKKLRGEGEPDSAAIRAAGGRVRARMAGMAETLERTRWLAGEEMTVADLAAAAQFSVLDYMGDAAWEEHPAVKLWYSLMKSRPSFRAILDDRVTGVPPTRHYRNPDF